MNELPGKVIGIDPGKMNGIAIFNGDGSVDGYGQMDLDELLDWTTEYEEPVSAVIVEDFILFKKRAIQQSGSRMHASQVIGMMKSFAKRKDAFFLLQKSDILPTAEKISGVKMPADHSISHQISAYNHAYFWMHKAGIVRSALEKEKLGE